MLPLPSNPALSGARHSEAGSQSTIADTFHDLSLLYSWFLMRRRSRGKALPFWLSLHNVPQPVESKNGESIYADALLCQTPKARWDVQPCS